MYRANLAFFFFLNLIYSGPKATWHLNVHNFKYMLSLLEDMLEYLTRLGPIGLVQFQTVFSFILMSIWLDAVWNYFTIVIFQYFTLGTECKYLRFNMRCSSLSIRKYAMFPIFLCFEWMNTEGLPTGCLLVQIEVSPSADAHMRLWV